ncbi:hypothetical protein AB0D27_25350 [Streptomyces sp. NPDC048415]|uniref:hypothetical protein n=1 Tax=Streptomyces sp. NPDC048415 TaxID=3154822 RepID=UPI003448A333
MSTPAPARPTESGWYLDHTSTADGRFIIVITDHQATVLAHRSVTRLTPQDLTATLADACASHPPPHQLTVDHSPLYDVLQQICDQRGITLTRPALGTVHMKGPAEQALSRLT